MEAPKAQFHEEKSSDAVSLKDEQKSREHEAYIKKTQGAIITTPTTTTKKLPQKLPQATYECLADMPVHDLKLILEKYGVSGETCIEKSELVALVQETLEKMKLDTQPPQVQTQTQSQGQSQMKPQQATSGGAVSSVAPLDDILKKLQRIEKNLTLETKHKPLHLARITALQNELREIESFKHGDIWCGELSQGKIPAGQAAVNETFEKVADKLRAEQLKSIEAYDKAHPEHLKEATSSTTSSSTSGSSITHPNVHVSAILIPIHSELLEMRRQLIQFLKQKFEIDSVTYDAFHLVQYRLHQLEQNWKHDGIWCGSLIGGVIPEGQAVIQDLVENCYRIIQQINTFVENGSTPSEANKKRRDEASIWNEMKCQPFRVKSEQQQVVCVRIECQEVVSPTLHSVFSQLVEYRHRLQQSDCSLNQLKSIQYRINELEEVWKENGIWRQPPQSKAVQPVEVHSTPQVPFNIPKGQAILNRELETCHSIITKKMKALEKV